jgi:diazepam-binding inhibitor (GABA receptor modulating acyl-CoA-binding protein)
MSDLQSRFAKAQQDVNTLTQRPDNDTLLKLYALFKQATQGDATGEQPSAFDFVRRAKFEAWSALKGTPKKASMEQYVDLVESLRR